MEVFWGTKGNFQSNCPKIFKRTAEEISKAFVEIVFLNNTSLRYCWKIYQKTGKKGRKMILKNTNKKIK